MKRNTIKAYILIFLAALLSSLGQLAWKYGAEAPSLSVAYYLIGFVLAGFGMLVMMLAFRYGQVSILQPMMSLGFVLSIFWGSFFLEESITFTKIVGTLFIVLGSVVLGNEETVVSHD